MPDTKTVHVEPANASHLLDSAGLRYGVGFAGRKAVELAAALFEQEPPDNRGPSRERPVPRSYRVELSPGAIRLRHAQVEGWEPRADPRHHVNDVAGDNEQAKAMDLLEHHFSLEDDRVPVDLEGYPGPAEMPGTARIVGWSKASRRRMIYRLATLEWDPVIAGPAGTRPAMVTLTYPGDWLAVAPDQETAKAHLQAFRRAWDRELPHKAIGPWKMEFQARGAPHFHLYLACPVGKVTYKIKADEDAKYRTEKVTVPFHTWVSETWARIVDAQGDEKARHLRAGTGVDYAEGARCSDPKRLAIYFARHNAKGSKDKAYQHRPPAEWAGTGRWWGIWRMDPATQEVHLSESAYLEARRLLRRWTKAQGRMTTNYRTTAVNEATGAVRRRRQNRRVTGAWLGHRSMSGGWSLLNDAPAFAVQLARHLATMENP